MAFQLILCLFIALCLTPSPAFAQDGGESPSESYIREAHGAVMSAVFVVLMPLGALLIYAPAGRKTIPWIHAPFQIFTVALAIAGLGLGVALADPDEYGGYHPIIGYVVVGMIVLVQPTLGLVQHLLFRRKEQMSLFGVAHRWLGRAIIALGIINGGLGFMFSGPVGSDNVPEWGVVVYSVVSGLVGVVYTALSSGCTRERVVGILS